MARVIAILIGVLLASVAAAGEPRPSVFERGAESGLASTSGRIDELVHDDLKSLGIEPAGLCSDSAFVRRVCLDVIGTLPSEAEARAFLSDQDPNKRRVLIDRLLERSEFADYWAMKWSDLLRVKSEFPINLWPNAVQAYHHWIRAGIRENLPYDRFVRQMLTANGSNFRVPQVNFYRAVQSKDPQTLARTVALTFMGCRAENWPKERLSGMAAFFSRVAYKSTLEWKEEIVMPDPNATGPLEVTFPDGTATRIGPDRDPREVFADWLTSPENPWFARSIVNRIWSWLLGRGIVHEPDDMRPDNPPSNPALLTFLERELIASHYDLKHVYRLILNSNTYQLSCVRRATDPNAAIHFAFCPLRRLEAEVLIDAICQTTGTTEEYSSPIPEPYTFIPDGERSIWLADASITSSFLETFGRPPRDTGLESERNNHATAAQRLHLLNSSHIQGKIEQGPKLQTLFQRPRPRDVIDGLYLTILSRFPTDEELQVAQAHFQAAGGNRRPAAVDLAWALINSAEFQYRH
jgi:hypothetical protein